MTYFNVFAGGLKAAATQYETDYWVTSYKEAAEWINHKLANVEKNRWCSLQAMNTIAFVLNISSIPGYKLSLFLKTPTPQNYLKALTTISQLPGMPCTRIFPMRGYVIQLEGRGPNSQ